MGESMSRYSIVERVTKMKLEVMEQKSRLDEKLTQAEQQLQLLSKNLEDDKRVIEENSKTEQRRLTRRLEEAQFEVQNLKTSKNKKEQMLNDQITALDSALQSIKDISEQAAQQVTNITNQ